VGSEPVRNVIRLEQLAQRRDQAAWNARMAPALAQRNCQVMQSTSDEAPGLWAYVAHHLEAHHAPDVFHVQHELSKAVCAPMATKARAAHKAATAAQAQLDQGQAHLQTAGDEPEKRGPGRPPKAPVSLEQAQQELAAASREHERLAQQREHVTKSIRGIGRDYHCVDLERGVRRNGKLIARDSQAHMAQVRAIAQHEGRNGYLSLRNHQLRGLDLPRKRECLTAIHNFFLTRPDGTTAAERFFGQKPRSMFASILESVELPPAPLSPPRLP
jgi:hypothetical protein